MDPRNPRFSPGLAVGEFIEGTQARAQNPYPGAHILAAGLGFMGMPLAFLALPLYVYLPHHDVQVLGLPMAEVGLVFLLARSLDAVSDPLWGALWDRMFKRNLNQALGLCSLLAVVLCACLWALLLPQAGCRWVGGVWAGMRTASPLGLLGSPPPCAEGGLITWVAFFLMLAGVLYSALALAQQTWSARLGGGPSLQSRLAAWRESLGLAGVVLASLLWHDLALGWSAGVFSGLMAVAMLLWVLVPKWARATRAAAVDGFEDRGVATLPAANTIQTSPRSRSWARRVRSMAEPLAQGPFRALLGVFALNGTASAVAATLFIFYVEDNLQSKPQEAYFLGVYFLSAALSCPLWLKVIEKKGLSTAWQMGMALSVLVFLIALGLGAGDTAAFYLVCALTGVALGADLVVPTALLVEVLGELGQSGQHEGRYFAWWQVVNKLNLALAAGLGLPLLSIWGYEPGVVSASSLQALILGYALLPCVMKALALVFLRQWAQGRAR